MLSMVVWFMLTTVIAVLECSDVVRCPVCFRGVMGIRQQKLYTHVLWRKLPHHCHGHDVTLSMWLQKCRADEREEGEGEAM